MTDQQSLHKVWALNGGVTDPGDPKYTDGWIAEIPTYQNFNYVLQTTTKNILSAAEKGCFAWDTNVSYGAGSHVIESGVQYFALVANSGQQPSLDTLHNYWSRSPTLGAVPDITDKAKGLHLKSASFDGDDLLWNGNAATITDVKPLVGLYTEGASKNLLLGNISGNAVVVDVDTGEAPDGRNIAIGQAGVHKIYHQGNKPTQSEIDDTIPANPVDGSMYARRDTNWVKVTSTVVSSAPPPAVSGSGTGWYNLDDGVFYIDINDGDSSQWVPANAPYAYLQDSIGGGGAGLGDDNTWTGTQTFEAQRTYIGKDVGAAGAGTLRMYGLADSAYSELVRDADGFLMRSSSFEAMLKAKQDDAVELYFNGSKKLETLTDGVNISGSLKVDGAAITLFSPDTDYTWNSTQTFVGRDIGDVILKGATPNGEEQSSGRLAFYSTNAQDQQSLHYFRGNDTDLTLYRQWGGGAIYKAMEWSGAGVEFFWSGNSKGSWGDSFYCAVSATFNSSMYVRGTLFHGIYGSDSEFGMYSDTASNSVWHWTEDTVCKIGYGGPAFNNSKKRNIAFAHDAWSALYYNDVAALATLSTGGVNVYGDLQINTIDSNLDKYTRVAMGTLSGGATPVFDNEFGIASISRASAGVYTITLDAAVSAQTKMVPMASGYLVGAECYVSVCTPTSTTVFAVHFTDESGTYVDPTAWSVTVDEII